MERGFERDLKKRLDWFDGLRKKRNGDAAPLAQTLTIRAAARIPRPMIAFLQVALGGAVRRRACDYLTGICGGSAHRPWGFPLRDH